MLARSDGFLTDSKCNWEGSQDSNSLRKMRLLWMIERNGADFQLRVVWHRGIRVDTIRSYQIVFCRSGHLMPAAGRLGFRRGLTGAVSAMTDILVAMLQKQVIMVLTGSRRANQPGVRHKANKDHGENPHA